MRKDFDLIVKKFPTDCNYINLYPVGDMQIGSANFSEKIWQDWKSRVLSDPNGYVVIVGDTINNGIKRSKTNVYAETMRPREQKHWLEKELSGLRHRILGAVRGNHEERSVNETDDCPLYDVMCKLDLEDLYRENMAFLKINLGKRTADRQVSYVIALAHGGNKARYFGYAVDGMDVLITGHTHQSNSGFPAKIVVDTHNEVIKMVGFTHVVVPSFDTYGGYVLKGMYMPQDSTKIPRIGLNGVKKEVSVLWK